jgi:hypothetical protein
VLEKSGTTVVPVEDLNKEITMTSFLANDSQTFKIRVHVNDCASPAELKHLRFTGEQYDSNGNKIEESSYDFFLNEEQIRNLGENLKRAVA